MTLSAISTYFGAYINKHERYQ